MLFNKLYDAWRGPVESETVMKALELMLYGMAGIFVVMLLVFVVIVALNRFTKKKKPQENDKK